jgi:hypothetical protein
VLRLQETIPDPKMKQKPASIGTHFKQSSVVLFVVWMGWLRILHHRLLRFRCLSRKTKEVYAAKKIQKGSLTDQQAIDDVVREVQILKVLKGRPNNVEFFGAFEDDKEVTIVLECATKHCSIDSRWLVCTCMWIGMVTSFLFYLLGLLCRLYAE